jgi:hypothetical protein
MFGSVHVQHMAGAPGSWRALSLSLSRLSLSLSRSLSSPPPPPPAHEWAVGSKPPPWRVLTPSRSSLSESLSWHLHSPRRRSKLIIAPARLHFPSRLWRHADRPHAPPLRPPALPPGTPQQLATSSTSNIANLENAGRPIPLLVSVAFYLLLAPHLRSAAHTSLRVARELFLWRKMEEGATQARSQASEACWLVPRLLYRPSTR